MLQFGDFHDNNALELCWILNTYAVTFGLKMDLTPTYIVHLIRFKMLIKLVKINNIIC